MNTRFVVAALAGIFIVCSYCEAIASSFFGRFSGTVTSGSDVNNLFGLGAGANLTGQTITGIFSFDFAAFYRINVDSTYGSIGGYGGPVFGAPRERYPGVVIETINGHSVTWVGMGASSFFVVQNPAYYSDGSATDIPVL